jgi:intracellular multiplication protein IcmC
MRPTAWCSPALGLRSGKTADLLQLLPFLKGGRLKAGGIFRISTLFRKFQKSPRPPSLALSQGDPLLEKGVKTRGYQLFLALLLLLFHPQAYAVPDIGTIMSNLKNVITPLTIMLLAISYAAGVYFIFSGLMMMKKMGNFATQQSQPGELSGPMVKILVGAALIYLPSSTDTITHSLFGGAGASLFGNGGVNYNSLKSGSSLLGYMGGDSFNQQWVSIANTLVMYIQFLGLLSFVKGWFIISGTAGHSSQPGVVGKGLTHIVGGIVAMNFVTAVNVIYSTIFSS